MLEAGQLILTNPTQIIQTTNSKLARVSNLSLNPPTKKHSLDLSCNSINLSKLSPYYILPVGPL
jgi:hypothetical protein